mgnify:CR=1
MTMLFGIESLDIAVGPLLAAVPESVGLLAFGIGLISAAGILRWVFSRSDEQTSGPDESE